MNEDEKVSIHAALEMFTSGQLLFLGLLINNASPSLRRVIEAGSAGKH